MKTWITYIAALLMGLATALLIEDSAEALNIASTVSSFMINLCICIAVPVIFITFSSGIASLGRDKLGKRAFLATVLWAIVTTLVMALIGALLSLALPVSFPITSSAGNPQGILTNHVSYLISNGLNLLYPRNALWSVISATNFILPVIIVAWIFGLALHPSSDIIRPAYTTMNSFSEVMYRISRTCAVYGFFLVYVTSTYSFMALYQEKTIFVAPRFFAMLLIGTASIILIIIPFLYALFTGFKKNPYRILFRSLSVAIAAFASNNIISIIPMAEGTSRQNIGVQKRVASVSIPLLAVIGKGGSAFISTASLISLFIATTGTIPSLSVMLIAAAAIAAVSFISSIAVGTESIFITVAALGFLGINLYGAENAMIALLPLIGGLGVMIDSLIVTIGSNVAANFIDTEMEVPYKDTL